MIELDFNPQIGEQVLGPPSDARYEIVDRQANVAGEVLLTLRRLKDGSLFKNQPPILFKYPSEEQVKRAIQELLKENREFPKDLQEGRFKAVSNEMYDGTPRVVVYFYLKPDVVPSPERARVWNEFYRRLHAEIDPLLDDPEAPTWLQFMTREERSSLSAAS